MKAKVSALMDGEMDGREAADLIARLSKEEEGLEAWRTYHLIRAALHDDGRLSGSLTGRISARLESEPIVIAPVIAMPGGMSAGPARNRHSTIAWSVAASAAAVSLVAWLGVITPRANEVATEALASSKSDRPVPEAQVAAASPASPSIRPLSEEADDYLLAHQGYSPRSSLQGMAPYVRTVADQAVRTGGAR